MNEKRAWQIVMKKHGPKVVASVLAGAARQKFWLRLKIAWRIIRGASRDPR